MRVTLFPTIGISRPSLAEPKYATASAAVHAAEPRHDWAFRAGHPGTVAN
jgi:hypothetical protein